MRQPANDHGDEAGFEDIRRGLVLIGLGYLGIVCLALYVDYKVRMRRARRREQDGKPDGREEK